MVEAGACVTLSASCAAGKVRHASSYLIMQQYGNSRCKFQYLDYEIASHAALIVRMNRVNRESAVSSVAHRAAFAERSGVGQEVRSGRNVHMASRARRRSRLHRIDEPLRIGYRIQSREGQGVLLRAVDVTESAVREIGRRAGRRQSGEKNPRKVVMASAVAYDNKWFSAICSDIYAVVDAVHQQIEVDALRRRGFI